jgi:hypothetical protein
VSGYYAPGADPAAWVERACEGCGETFMARRSEVARRSVRFCSRACITGSTRPAPSATERATLSSARMGEANPNFRHGGRAGEHSRAGSQRFVDADARRCRHPRCRGGSTVGNQHHVVYRQEVRREGGDVWDGRNALALCEGCHSSHHRRGDRVVPLTALRDENYDFARELLGGGRAYEYLRRRYAGEDPRLEALLINEEDLER